MLFMLAAAAVTGLAAGGALALVHAGAERATRRLGRPGLATALLIALAAASALWPVHRLFTKRGAGAWLLTGYAVFPLALVALGIRRWWGARPRVVLAGTVVLFLAVHWVNGNVLAGLYPAAHRLMTAAEVLLLASGLLWHGVPRPRPILAALVVLGGLAATFSSGGAARAPTFFSGTETGHLFAAMDWVLDRDGDGFSGAFGGADCDDGDRRIHPLAFERPGNGVDDNCRMGDLAPSPASARLAPAPTSLSAWRAAHRKPNIVMVFVDTLRADHLRPDATPVLTELTTRAVTFEQARTTAPRTPHAWMSIIRGRFTGRTLDCRKSLRDPRKDTLPRRLRNAGYHTMAHFVGKSWPRYHLTSGWAHLEMHSHANRKSGAATTEGVKKMLARRPKGRPFFLVAHYADPHAPYLAPGVTLRERYRGEVRDTDAEVGRLLEALEDVRDETVLLVFSDHGENLGDHGDLGGHHGVSLYDEVTRVPLLVSGPGFTPSRVSDPVSVVDLAPTLLDLVGEAALDDPDGRSLAGYLLGEPPPPTFTVSEFYDFGHKLRAVVDGRFKLIQEVRFNARQLFDVVADPEELDDLSTREPERMAALQHTLDTWVETRADPSEPKPRKCEQRRR